MIHVLLIEEDIQQRLDAFRCVYLYDADAIVDCVESGEDAKRILQTKRYDIVLVHYEAPGICENEIWKYMHGAPVMLFTSSPTIEKEVFCFEKGAADYIVKPYDPQAAIARGKRLLQRNVKEFGKLKIDYYNNTVVLSGQEIPLTQTELKFLFYISKNDEGATFESIAKEVWGYDEPDMNSLRVLVSKINKKLDGAVENVRNWGYKIKK